MILFALFFGLSASVSFADSQYAFTCPESKIHGSIKYSVIGRYNAVFKECSGVINYDDIQQQVKDVSLEIKTKSIESDCQWCDKMVVSKKLLNADQFVVIAFQSKDFSRDQSDYLVNGVIDLHGVKKDISSVFTLKVNADGSLLLKGKWVLRRKDFGITWNKVLDHGGVLVGDHVTVDWEILAKKI
jgi:polyisoprenoid-binding protein YceI